MNVVLIGNGFDLAHGLSSRYTDFTTALVEEHLSDREKHQDIMHARSACQSYEEARSQLFSQLTFKNTFFLQICQKIGITNWCDIEELYFDLIMKLATKNQVSARIKLNSEFHEITQKLESYLVKEQEKSESCKAYEYLFKKLGADTSVINFNYTNTPEHYLPEENIHYIHGKLRERTNPIVFGYAADDVDSNTLLNVDNHCTRYLKEYLYKEANIYEKVINLVAPHGRAVNLIILGHSCGLSDRLILNEIISKSKVSRVYVSFFGGAGDYREKLNNINRICGKEIGLQKVRNIQCALEMPQCDLNDEIKGNIDRFVKTIGT